MIATSRMFAGSAPGRSVEPVRGGRDRLGRDSARQALQADKLVNAINRMLAARPDCQGLAFEGGPLSPVAPDADGCNWRAHGLRLRMAHGTSARAVAGVRQVVELARLRYNLADPDGF